VVRGFPTFFWTFFRKQFGSNFPGCDRVSKMRLNVIYFPLNFMKWTMKKSFANEKKFCQSKNVGEIINIGVTN